MIKNKDMPASPVVAATGEVFTGLTKREQLAAMAMQGILSNRSVIDCCTDISTSYAAEFSVVMADALLAELEK